MILLTLLALSLTCFRIMSGTGDRKQEWDKGHLNESWNTDSNGRFSFHHEQSSDRGVVKLYIKVKSNKLSGVLPQ